MKSQDESYIFRFNQWWHANLLVNTLVYWEITFLAMIHSNIKNMSHRSHTCPKYVWRVSVCFSNRNYVTINRRYLEMNTSNWSPDLMFICFFRNFRCVAAALSFIQLQRWKGFSARDLIDIIRSNRCDFTAVCRHSVDYQIQYDCRLHYASVDPYLRLVNLSKNALRIMTTSPSWWRHWAMTLNTFQSTLPQLWDQWVGLPLLELPLHFPETSTSLTLFQRARKEIVIYVWGSLLAGSNSITSHDSYCTCAFPPCLAIRSD